MISPISKGDPITEGVLLRYIPNNDINWEYDRDRVSPRAFRERPGEEYVSAYWDRMVLIEILEAEFPLFGIAAIAVERLSESDRLKAAYWPVPDDETIPPALRNAHARVDGINRSCSEWIARQVAVVLKKPAERDAAARGSADRDDRPRDPWQRQ